MNNLSCSGETIIQDLEKEAADLRLKLQILVDKDRMGRLERELNEIQSSNEKLTVEKHTIESNIRNLQHKLIEIESDNLAPTKYTKSTSEATEESILALYDGVREKEMEKLYLHAKKDKEKAMRILIQLIGKDRMSDFLDDNTGNPDLLERLHDGIMSRHIQIDTSHCNFSNSSSSISRTGSVLDSDSVEKRRQSSEGAKLASAVSPSKAVTTPSRKSSESKPSSTTPLAKTPTKSNSAAKGKSTGTTPTTTPTRPQGVKPK